MRAFILLAFASALRTLVLAADSEVIEHTSLNGPGGNYVGEIWEIKQPVVNVAQKEYPQIRFQAGDTIRIQAGGCVNTGGSGDTCKAYVNPSGDNSDSLYSGLISIPATLPEYGIGAGLVRIGTLSADKGSHLVDTTVKVMKVPAHDLEPDMYLRLGYQDSSGDFGDNRYEDHGDGNDDQCKDSGWAWIRLTITHAGPGDSAPQPSQPRAPMDLWYDSLDDNLLPLNPKWGIQVTHPGTIPNAYELCNHFQDGGDHLDLGGGTTWQPAVDEPSISSDPLSYAICHSLIDQHGNDVAHEGVHGHINWGYASYTGRIYFVSYEDYFQGDEDCNFELIRTDQATVTTGNDFRYLGTGPRGLSLEFAAPETVDRFSTKWWADFRTTLRNHSDDFNETKGLVDGCDAIVTGLVGIDNQHDAKAEVHPVLGLAIQVATTPTENIWEFFARNHGNEGKCSQNQHFYPGEKMQFFFPDVDAVMSIDIRVSTVAITWGSKVFPDGVLFAVSLPDPQLHAVAYGEIHLKRRPTSPTSRPLKPLQGNIRQNWALHEKRRLMEEEERSRPLAILQAIGERRPEIVALSNRLAEFRANAGLLRIAATRTDDIAERRHKSLGTNDPRPSFNIDPKLAKFDLPGAQIREQKAAAVLQIVGGPERLEEILKEAAEPDSERELKKLREEIRELRQKIGK